MRCSGFQSLAESRLRTAFHCSSEKNGARARHIEAGWTASLWMWVQMYWFRVVYRIICGQVSCNPLAKGIHDEGPTGWQIKAIELCSDFAFNDARQEFSCR